MLEDPGVFFSDGKRKIDMVLAFEDSDSEDDKEPLDDSDIKEHENPVHDQSRRSSRALSINMPHLDKVEIREKRRQAKKTFEDNVRATGLQIEYEHKSVRNRSNQSEFFSPSWHTGQNGRNRAQKYAQKTTSHHGFFFLCIFSMLVQ